MQFVGEGCIRHWIRLVGAGRGSVFWKARDVGWNTRAVGAVCRQKTDNTLKQSDRMIETGAVYAGLLGGSQSNPLSALLAKDQSY